MITLYAIIKNRRKNGFGLNRTFLILVVKKRLQKLKTLKKRRTKSQPKNENIIFYVFSA